MSQVAQARLDGDHDKDKADSRNHETYWEFQLRKAYYKQGETS